MSCIADLELLSTETRKKISADLEVSPKETKYGKKESVLCFDTFNIGEGTDDEKYYVSLPFAYVYQNMKKELNIMFPNGDIVYPRTSGYTFDGTLNSIQNEVKPEAYDILNRTRSILISLACGMGKCLHPDTPILLWNGDTKKSKDIIKGDLLIGDDNTPRTVLSICKGRETMYKIKQNSADDYTVNESHILSLKVSQHKRYSWQSSNEYYSLTWFDFNEIRMRKTSFSIIKYGNKEEAFAAMEKFKLTVPDNDILDINVKDYMNLPQSVKYFLKGFRVGVEFPEQQIFIDPYVLGAWLGDGDSTGRGFTNIDDECLSYFKEYIRDIGCEINPTPSAQIHYDIKKSIGGRNHFLDMIDFYSLRKNKHIPKDFLINSRENRLQLLAGLLDTDGYLTSGCFEITQKNKKLSDDILYLVRSLGFNANQKEVIKSCVYKGERREGTYYKILFSGEGIDTIPTKIKRKQASERIINKNTLICKIDVEKLEVGDYCGFEIDGNRRFLLGDFTVTHNTIMAIFIASQLQYKACVLCHRINIIDQWEYAIHKVCPEALVQVLQGNTPIDPAADFYIMNVSNVGKRGIDDFNHVGILIVDEAHTICTENMSRALFYFKPKYLIGLTATPDRTDGMGKILDLYFGTERIVRKLRRPFNAYVYNTGFKPKSQQNAQGRLDWNSVLESQALEEKRNCEIVDVVRYFKTRTFLILCKRIDQTNILLKKLKAAGEDVDVFVGTKRTFNYESRILLSTYSKTGVGFDHPRLDALIVASDVEEGIEQYVGRVFRREDVVPIVFDFLDKMHTLFKHFLTRRLLYLSIGGDVKQFDETFPEFIKWRKMYKF